MLPPTLSVQIAITPQTLPAGSKVEVRATGPISAGRAFPRPKHWKFLFAYTPALGIINCKTEYLATFGKPIKNATIWFECIIVTPDGQRSSPLYGHCKVS